MTKKTTANKADTPVDIPAKAGDVAVARVENLKKQSGFKNCPKCNRAFKKQDSLDKHVQGCKSDKQPGAGFGGAREGAGRPAGGENEKTKQLKEIKQGMQMAIAGKVGEILTSQFRSAIGNAKLYVRRTVKEEYTDPKGKVRKKERIDVRQVFDDVDFLLYLSLKHDEYGRAKDSDTGDEYYYMAPKEGNAFDRANMLDRAFGKPKESMDVGIDPDTPIGVAGTGTTTELRKAFVALVKAQIKQPEEGK